MFTGMGFANSDFLVCSFGCSERVHGDGFKAFWAYLTSVVKIGKMLPKDLIDGLYIPVIY